MTSPAAPGRNRIDSIDIVRGLIMVIMALDHVRDFFHKTAVEGGASVATNPTDLETTTPALFFTRWITHFCAPIFVFLAGTSAFLAGQKMSRQSLSGFLIKRGFWLVLVELVIITFGWTFNPLFNVIILQVIWAIGVSMIILGLMVRLPFTVILATGLAIIFLHNLLDYPSIGDTVRGSIMADLAYFATFGVYPLDSDHFVLVVYSFLPWTGLMLVGYYFGRVYLPRNEGNRRRLLFQLGFSLVIFFILLRLVNAYGDPVPWSEHHRGPIFTFLSFINITKYPPSLAFTSLTLGVGFIALALFEETRSRVTGFLRTYGRVPMFYYILHFYIIHLLVVVVFFASGYSTSQISTPNNPFFFRPSDFGFPLWGVYAVWIVVLVLLNPLCRWYDRYKSTHRKWWLRYL